MRGTIIVGALVFVSVALAMVLDSQDKASPGGIPWSVDAHRSVRWTLVCRIIPAKSDHDLYNPHDWRNLLRREGRGSESGNLLDDNGRCTLAKTAGKGPATLTLTKDGAPRRQATDTGREPAYVEVF